jgi:hypothetical protein
MDSAPNNVVLSMEDLKRLGRMLVAAIVMAFIMIVVSFYVGHHLGQQTVAQEIHVEPVVRTHSEFQIDTHLAIQESQKQPATFRVSAADGATKTITQEQIEQISRSIASVRAEIGEIKDGIRSPAIISAEAKTPSGAEKPKPVVIQADAEQRAVPDYQIEKPKDLPQAKPEAKPVPATLSGRLTILMDRAEQVASRMESITPGTKQAWESKWKSRLQDGHDENQLANEALLERLVSIKGSRDAGKPLEMSLAFETSMLLLRYRAPNMQLPAPMLDILRKDDKSFAETLNFITQVAKAP